MNDDSTSAGPAHGETDGAIRHTSDRDRLALKAAWRRLVALAGGNEPAAACTRVEFREISHYGAPADAKKFPPIDVVLDVERAVGVPVVTAELARQHDAALHHLAPPPAASLSQAIARLGQEAAEVFGAVAGAGAHVDHVEAAAIVKEIDDLAAALAAARTAAESLTTPAPRRFKLHEQP